MLKKLMRILSPGSAGPDVEGPHIVAPRDHPLNPGDISRGARKVVETLEAEGFEAFVVGGCVRDMLLELRPKDFDVATDATPEQVKELFRRARVVGRRFRIAHVYFGGETVEVTTFRAGHSGDDGRKARRSDDGMLLRDNVYGDIDEDARRRDFTINALYYHPHDNTLYDYANGLRDIERRQLVAIGDPPTRYREDPVRMLRAARFAAKLAFQIAPDTAAPIEPLGNLLTQVAPARLFDEFLKLFLAGHALATFHLLQDYHLFGHLFPETRKCLEEEGDDGFYHTFIDQALTNTDLRVRGGKSVTPAFLLAAFLWPVVVKEQAALEAGGESPPMALQKAAGRVIGRQVERIAIPRRFSQPMREIWELQQRLPKRHGTRAEHLVSLPRFRAAYDFLLLREESGEDLDGLGHWWTKYQDADDRGRRNMVEALGPASKGRGRRKRRRPGKRKPGNDS